MLRGKSQTLWAYVYSLCLEPKVHKITVYLLPNYIISLPNCIYSKTIEHFTKTAIKRLEKFLRLFPYF